MSGMAFHDEGGDRLDRSTLGRQIADAIRRDILLGRIDAGERLGQQQLCSRFGTSRMPVRDALRQLAYEGFVLSDGGRHAVVARMRRGDIEDTYAIEGTLHGFAARRVAETARDDEIADLRARHEEMVATESDIGRLADLNYAFHRRINQLADSRKLLAALRTLALNIPRDYLVQFPEWAQRTNREHAEIVAAFEARDGERVEELMRAHVADAGRYLVRYLEDSGVDLG